MPRYTARGWKVPAVALVRHSAPRTVASLDPIP
jgi:hypothetical protein